MRKFLVVTMMMVVFGVGLPLTVDGQTRCRRSTRTYATRTTYPVRYYSTQRRPSFYRRHRNLINIGIATAGGALVGGLLGGRRGVGLGLLAGAGAGALYTYKLNPKRRRYRAY